MKKIGIKLADGSFYPIMDEGVAAKTELNVTTVKDNQTTVKVGLYSSESSSMQDAIHLDTLKISNLKKQLNGAPTIKLSLQLDDKGQLSAELVDSDTGKEAKTSITLVSNSDMLDNDKNPDTGKGLLGAAEEINASDGIALSEKNLPLPDDEPFVEEEPSPEVLSDEAMPEETQLGALEDGDSLDEENLPEVDESAAQDSELQDFDLPEETQVDALEDGDSLDEENLPEVDENPAQDSELQDFDLPEETQLGALEDDGSLDEENLLEVDESPAQDSELQDFDLPEETQVGALEDDSSLDEENLPEVDESPAQDSELQDFDLPEETQVDALENDGSLDEENLPEVDENPAQDSELQDFDLPEETQLGALEDGDSLNEENLPEVGESTAQDSELQDFDLPEETQVSALEDDGSLDEENLPEVDESPAQDSELQDFDLPEETQLDALENDNSLNEENLPEIDESPAQDSGVQDFDLPDFDENIFSETTDAKDSALPQSEIQEAFGASEDKLDFSDMDFEMPDFDESTNSGTNFDDLPDFDSPNYALDDPFSDNDDFANENKKTQKWPMIICLVCAFICVLAVLSLLFIIPSKFNVFSSRDRKIQIESAQEVTQLPPPAEPKVEEIQVPIAPAAKEDEVVVIPQAELVVPDLPYGEKTEHKPKEILYKIKWGDTLWDLSATYYKNPWLYPKIAKYNNIKNPNYIVAGTYIKIPEE